MKKKKKEKHCPLCVCMDGLCGRMGKLGVGQTAWPGRAQAGRMQQRGGGQASMDRKQVG